MCKEIGLQLPGAEKSVLRLHQFGSTALDQTLSDDTCVCVAMTFRILTLLTANCSPFLLMQLKGRGDTEDLQERVLQAAASGQEGSSGEPRGALHSPAAAARPLRGNKPHLTPRESTSHERKKKKATLFIAHILNRHLLRQHSLQQG